MRGLARCRTPPGATLAGCFRTGQGETDRRDYLRHAPHGRATASKRRRDNQISLSCVRSSMFMSLNSLDSKTSPHSLHSTNSESSSRPTICTRGCLQGCLVSRSWGGAGDLEVINREGSPEKRCGVLISVEFPGILDWLCQLSRPYAPILLNL